MEINLCMGCMEKITSNPCPHCGYDARTRRNPDYALRIGTILNGKYLVGKVLGQGGFGITYIGWDLAQSKKVAIKEYFPSSCVTRTAVNKTLQWYDTEQAREAQYKGREIFLKEARKMSRVATVPNVVLVLDLFLENETAYIIMDYIQGENLMQRIKRTGPLPWQSAKQLLLPVAETMQKVHAAGLIHRDLSPDNMIIQPDGSISILDLGAAKDMNLHSGASSMQVAKSGFSPLEQYTQRGGSGTWTDVYALAATMYYALTGVVPPSAVDRMDRDPIRWDLPQLQKLPAEVLQVLKQAMALQAKDRLQTMAAFANSIRNAVQPKKQRLRYVGILVACFFGVLVLILGLFGQYLDQPDSRDNEAAEEQTVTESDATYLQDPSEMPWGDNVMMYAKIPEAYQFDSTEAPAFGSHITRRQIVSVTFLDSVDNAGSDSWDISEKRNGSVLAWVKQNGTVEEWSSGDGGSSGFVQLDAYDLYIAAVDGINGKYCSRLFQGFSNLKQINFNGCFHTDYAENMEYMFYGCQSLQALKLSELKTARVRNMQNMFYGTGLVELDLRGFDTSNVENMSGLFGYCHDLRELDLSHLDTSKVTNMSNMFALCSSFTELDVSGFDTSNVTDMSFMFTYIDLEELDLSGFDTSNVVSMAYMFSGSDHLVTLNMRGFDTSKVTNMSGMFSGCESLRAAWDVEEWDFSNVTYYDSFMDDGITIQGKPWREYFEKDS